MKRLPITLSTVFEMLTADELHRFPTLDHWFCRPLSKPHAEGLSPEAKRRRRLAQVRMCRFGRLCGLWEGEGGHSPHRPVTAQHVSPSSGAEAQRHRGPPQGT